MGGGARSRRDGRQRQWSSGRDGAARAAAVAGRDSGRKKTKTGSWVAKN